jgi:glycosyltransferase involved in cell wall biosynthesis
MPGDEKSVLHVLPHPGGGGETYVDALVQMDGYRFERVYVAPGADPRGHLRTIVRRSLLAQRAALAHDLVHVIGEVASLLTMPAMFARPSIFSPQGLSLLRRMRGARKVGATANLKLVVRASSRTICSSEHEYGDVVAAAGERVRDRVLVVRNAVSTDDAVGPEERAAARGALGFPASEIVGAWIGSLDENKDPLTPMSAAIEARRNGTPVVLMIVGEGALRPEAEQVARDGDNGSAVRVLGFRTDVRRILAAADFFVLSSAREGLSFSLLEAMAAGLPAVVSDAPANLEAVGDAGIVVPYGNVARFAEAFGRIAADEPTRRALGERARERVVNEFRVEDMVERTRKVYDELMTP